MKESKIPNPFRVEDEVRRAKSIDFAIKSLRNEWNLPDDLIVKVATKFECASEGNIFLDYLDGADDIQDAWERYCDFRGTQHEYGQNPFSEYL